jgi:hypothetical protein
MVCEDCLQNKPELLGKTARRLRRVPSSSADKGVDRHIDRDRDGDDAYLGQKVYIDNYTKKQGRAPASTTLLWPKCYRHPDRSTRDLCSG